MKEIIIGIISTLIGAIVTYLKTSSDNKKELELASQSHEIKIQELNQKLILKDKEIEQLKLEHELELKSKEADVINPIMGEFIKDAIKDPSKMKDLFDLKAMADQFSKGDK